VYNVAVGDSTTLNELHDAIAKLLADRVAGFNAAPPVYREFRAGDVRYSLADISRARTLLGYRPTFRAQQGLERAIDWYVAQLAPGHGELIGDEAEEAVLAAR
jgi:UDP-N-acetylglucosamine 4-epimerase